LKPYLFVFDVLYYGGDWLLDDFLTDRKAVLTEALDPVDGPPPPGPWDDSVRQTSDERGDQTATGASPIVRAPVVETSFEDFYRGLTENGEEGVVMKRRRSRYHLDTRSAHWRKVKATAERDAIVVGFTDGRGGRKDSFGSLVLTDGVAHIGRVGSGFSDTELEALLQVLTPVEKKPIPESTVGRPYTPVKPFVVRVRYQEVNNSGSLRAPVYVHMRPDVPLEDVQPVDPNR
jgi:bifunctional non-homologous end joining protein LigD